MAVAILILLVWWMVTSKDHQVTIRAARPPPMRPLDPERMLGISGEHQTHRNRGPIPGIGSLGHS